MNERGDPFAGPLLEMQEQGRRVQPPGWCLGRVLEIGEGKLKILALLPLALFGLHPHFRGVTVRRCQKLQALSSVPLAVHADGESFQRRSRVTFTCLGQKLSVISGNSKGNRKGA